MHAHFFAVYIFKMISGGIDKLFLFGIIALLKTKQYPIKTLKQKKIFQLYFSELAVDASQYKLINA